MTVKVAWVSMCLFHGTIA